MTGKTPDDLIPPPFPDRLEHVWQAFLELHAGRSYSSNGPNPISWEAMDAWARLTKAAFDDWEFRAIKALDLVWLRVMGEGANNE